jgi:single-strand DNA-binding protein
MGNINRVTLTGYLTREPELRQAGAGTVLSFGIGVNERHKNSRTDTWEERASFFEVLVWGKRSEALSPILHKGMKVALSGKLKQSQWQAQDGSRRSRVEVVADEVDLMVKNSGEGIAKGATPPETEDLSGEDIPF